MANTQEIKTVRYEEYSRGGCRSLIEIFAMDSIYEDSGIQMGVNWAALGTVSPEETEEFAYTLLEAAEDCRNFKYNGYVIDWAAPSERNH